MDRSAFYLSKYATDSTQNAGHSSAYCSLHIRMIRFSHEDCTGVITIRLKIEESNECQEVEITIRCPEVDERLTRLIRQINQMMYSFTVKKDDAIQSIDSDEVLYIETVDNTTFLYTAEDVFESELKLYEFESQLKETSFLRVSKHLIVNTSKVESVRALLNGRFEAILETGEKVIVNRHYAKQFRKHFLG